MRRDLVAGRYGVLGSGSGSAPRTRRPAVARWFSRSRPCDRAPHERSRNPRHPPRARRPRRIPFQVALSGLDDRIPRHSCFSPRRPCHAGHLVGDDYRGLFPKHPRRHPREPAVRINLLPRRSGYAEMAPLASGRRMSDCPISLAWPSRVLPPVECCIGTRAGHAPKSRPCMKPSISGTLQR